MASGIDNRNSMIEPANSQLVTLTIELGSRLLRFTNRSKQIVHTIQEDARNIKKNLPVSCLLLVHPIRDS